MTHVRIGSVVGSVRTWDPAKQGDGMFTYMDLSSVDQAKKAITGQEVIQCAAAPSRARQLVATGDVLVSTVRPNLNAVATVPPELAGATASTGFCVLRPRTDVLDGRYLFHWVQSPSFVGEMVSMATGASYPAISDRIIKESLIPLPRLEEQRRIAIVLDSADALRVKRREALAKLDTLSQAIFVDMFGVPSSGSGSGWVLLDELVRDGDKINYGVVQPGDHVIDGRPLIRVGDLVGGRVDHSAIKRIDPSIDAQYRRSKLVGDEVLVSCVGSIGSVALVTEAEAGWNIARAVARVPLASTVRREYVAEFLRSSFVQRYFASELRTVSQPTLNIKQIREAPIRVPSLREQDRFVDCIGKVDRMRAEQLHSSDVLGHLFACLQQRAFRGDS